MRPLSIRNRLSLWLILSVAVLFALHWLVTSRAPVHFTETYVASRLEHDAQSLLVGLQIREEGAPRIDPAYIATIYERPLSGHYYEVRFNGERLRSRSLWDQRLQLPVQRIESHWRGRIRGPQQQTLFVWAQRYNKQGKSILVIMAEDLGLIQTLIDEFHMQFALISAGLLGILILIMRFVVRWGLHPLDHTRRQLQRLEQGEIGELPPAEVPEVRPLVSQINHLLQVMRQRLQRSRNAAGNLAHALKTPLAYLSQLAEGAGTDLSGEQRREISRTVQSLNETIDRELKRARLAGQSAGGQRFDVGKEIPELVRVLEQIHAQRGIRIHAHLPGAKQYPADPQDMLELFGNLLDNAAKWARANVWLEIGAGGGLAFTLEDDGDGIPPTQLAQLQGRGTRLDEMAPGHGLGLAIVREIVEQYHGTITFAASARGGLAVSVRLP